MNGGWQLKSKWFRINKYDLPKFDVSIDVPRQVAFEDEVVTVTVRSMYVSTNSKNKQKFSDILKHLFRYTFGKPVKGKAYFRIQPTGGKGAISTNVSVKWKYKLVLIIIRFLMCNHLY